MKNFKNYQDFWPFYLSQHSKRSTRLWHFVGTTFVFICILTAILTGVLWYILLAPIIAYGFAWCSHFFIEGNKPATFGHPVWSLRADFRMYWLILTRQLDKEIVKLPKDFNMEA
ncbi:Mpo1-like protein [Bacillus salitolerans]|uniref:Mpo1-like protein n=1 Tax=Bacillus salitolerans TaxID=1437434 RepID=A0ABW4LKP5_9BACI